MRKSSRELGLGHPVPDWKPMTQQARRAPELPVVLLSSVPPLPRSSGRACAVTDFKCVRTTKARPMMLWCPMSEIMPSLMYTLALPVTSALMLPKSPTC
ncbi:unnamed protein product, partial [Ixodes persulcatus]